MLRDGDEVFVFVRQAAIDDLLNGQNDGPGFPLNTT